jgi:peptide deformylase
MALLPIVTYPDARLREKAISVTEFDATLQQLIEDMAETMYAAPGIGLAANQVGVLKRIFIIDIAGEGEPSDLKVFINPELTLTEGLQSYEEGCLSFPGASEEIKRAAKVVIKAHNAKGELFELEAEGLLAVAIQHENDHINGVLMIDKVNPLARRKISRQVQRAAVTEPR